MFPLKLRFRGPGSDEITRRFDDVRSWTASLREMQHCRLEMREFKHRVLGKNSLPANAWIDERDDAFAMIGKRKDAARFAALVEMTRQRQPSLVSWLAKRPLLALDLCDKWCLFLDVIEWLQSNPRPDVYLRQLDVPGVHSKFIEEHRGVLSELLDCTLPEDTIDAAYSGVVGFARRYGFREKPQRVRFRILDPTCASLLGIDEADITLDCRTFANLNLSVMHVFIVENEINFLSFPPLPESMVIFGAGYGLEFLRDATWLERCYIYYWGDIDTHGFAILNSARKQFSHVQSLLMDESILIQHLQLCGHEEKQHSALSLSHLTPDEHAVYEGLKSGRWGQNLRLEQERVAWNRVLQQITALGFAAGDSFGRGRAPTSPKAAAFDSR